MQYRNLKRTVQHPSKLSLSEKTSASMNVCRKFAIANHAHRFYSGMGFAETDILLCEAESTQASAATEATRL